MNEHTTLLFGLPVYDDYSLQYLLAGERIPLNLACEYRQNTNTLSENV